MSRNSAWVALLALLFISPPGASGWGSTGHRFINKNAVLDLPPPMSRLISQQSFLADHSTDADARRATDPSEDPKHYIDIDAYPGFRLMPRTLDSVVALYGAATVTHNGVNPWATLWTLDSLTAQLRRGDWPQAYLTASDLGHYVADAHQPLHCTQNYDGAQTGNTGIHSRYETGMINAYQQSLTVLIDSAHYIGDPLDYVFDYILRSQTYADSVMQADSYAKAASGWNGVDAPPQQYYTCLWQQTGSFTLSLIQGATHDLASLWYTAWINAGLSVTTGLRYTSQSGLTGFSLGQNYPNPFNPATVITYTLPCGGLALLAVYSVDGHEVRQLVQEYQTQGVHEVGFDAAGLATGVYFYRLTFSGTSLTRRLLLVR